MNNLRISLSDEELEYVKARPRGWVRGLIQREMAGGEEPAVRAEERSVGSEEPRGTTPSRPAAPPRETIVSTQRRVTGPTCKVCGGLTLAGRCQVCKAIQ